MKSHHKLFNIVQIYILIYFCIMAENSEDKNLSLDLTQKFMLFNNEVSHNLDNNISPLINRSIDSDINTTRILELNEKTLISKKSKISETTFLKLHYKI